MALAFLRRHRRWFFVFLWVVILAFVILYIPNLDPAARLADSAVATVGGRPIKASLFQRQYLRQRRQFLATNQGMDEAMIERMGLKEQVLSSMVREELEGLEADRLGIQIDDEAVLKAITEDAQLQTDGRFVGSATLTRLLQQEGLSIADFETGVRRQLRAQRLREAITDGVAVSDAEVGAEFRRRSELIHAEYVHIGTASYEATIQPTEEAIQARFASAKERFRMPERRTLSYLLVDPIEMRAKVLPTGTEVENYYRNNAAEFTTPEQVCGRHVLIKVRQNASATEGHGDAEARVLAEAALVRIRKGEAFDKVAGEKSEDAGSAKNGGSLGCFGRGQMVPEFESAAFSLGAGAMSDLVKSSFGYHIIKVDTRLPASTTPLEQARKRIETQLQDTKARELAAQKAAAVAAALGSNQTLEQIATAQALVIKKSELLQLGKGAGVLTSPLLLSRAFELKAKETSKDGFQAGSGAVFFRVEDIVPPKTPDFSEVKEDVRKDLVKHLAREQAREAARTLAADAGRTSLEKAAAHIKGTRTETKGLVGRGQAFTEIPQSAVFEELVFTLPEKTLSAPIDTSTGVAVVRVLEKKAADETALLQQRESIRASLEGTKRDQIFSSYLQTLRDRFPITQNAEALANLR